MPTWIPSMAVGHATIDEQHQELFRRADDLIDAMMNGRAAGEMRQLLLFLRDYCRDHFGMEEGLMASTGYPVAEAHRIAHREFERRFAAIEKAMAEKGPSAAVILDTKDLIRGWLVDHIAAVDTRLAAFLRSRR